MAQQIKVDIAAFTLDDDPAVANKLLGKRVVVLLDVDGAEAFIAKLLEGAEEFLAKLTEGDGGEVLAEKLLGSERVRASMVDAIKDLGARVSLKDLFGWGKWKPFWKR